MIRNSLLSFKNQHRQKTKIKVLRKKTISHKLLLFRKLKIIIETKSNSGNIL